MGITSWPLKNQVASFDINLYKDLYIFQYIIEVKGYSIMKVEICLCLLLCVSMAFAQDDPCYDTYHDKESCNADDTLGGGCIWCVCSALPSACYTLEDSKLLPPSIYDCSKD